MQNNALRACVALLLMLRGAGSLVAQGTADSALRPITVTPTGVELTGPARPDGYVSAIGRRAIAMGTERGGFEIWTWPVKLLHGFELRFQTPLFSEPLAARNLARTVEVTPTGPVISYTHPAFTVRQRVFAALNEPAVVMLLDVDAVRPVEILAEFTSDLELAWPAGVGGQYVFWDDGQKAFVLSESQRKLNALVGSPFTTSATNQPAHDVPDAPSQLRIQVGDSAHTAMPRPGEPAGKLSPLHLRGIPIVIVGGALPRDTVKAIYRRVLAEIPRLYQEREAHAREVLDQSLRLNSPDAAFNRALAWAALNLDEALSCNPDLGCGLIAGYGPSEPRGARPGFAWFFGGDASINSLGMDATGQFDVARQGLEFFVKYQSAEGKIPHEISQSAGRIRWFEDYPYAFYHADTTPYWIMAWGDYWLASGDVAAVRRNWAAIQKAMQWCKGTVDPSTGLMLNSKGGLGAVEVGDLGVGVESDIYLSAVWIEALDRYARMAEALRTGDRKGAKGKPAADPQAAEARATREKALTTLRTRFWLPEQQMYAFALLQGGQVRPELTVWPATALAFGVADDSTGRLAASALAGSALLTDWGARSLGASSSLFDPLHYNNGTVWPFVTGFAALAQYRYQNPVAGFALLKQLIATGTVKGLGRNPEVFSGSQFEPLETAVPQQFFGTSFIPTVFVRGLLGWQPDAPAATVRLAPQLPAEWDSLSVSNLAVGDRRYEVRLVRSPGALRLAVRRLAGGAVTDTLVYTPMLPLGAVVTKAAEARLVLGGEVSTTVEFQPGFEILPGDQEPVRGSPSRGVRVVRVRRDGEGIAVLLDGPAGTSTVLRVRRGTVQEIPVRFPDGGDRVDGYSRAEVRLAP